VIGLDANIIPRLFDRTDAARTRAVERLLGDEANSDGCLVDPIVLAEFAWTLDRTYKLERPVIADDLDRILQASEFIVPIIDQVLAAAARYRNGPADCADYLFSEINRSLGCTTTVTFDRDAGKDDNFTLLTA
jgi:predicted nucleic-acid-binding protein